MNNINFMAFSRPFGTQAPNVKFAGLETGNSIVEVPDTFSHTTRVQAYDRSRSLLGHIRAFIKEHGKEYKDAGQIELSPWAGYEDRHIYSAVIIRIDGRQYPIIQKESTDELAMKGLKDRIDEAISGMSDRRQPT